LTGNYRSLDQEHHLAPVSFSGSLPRELASSLYARNGANASPRNNANPEIDFHWFDGYGAVAAVYFKLLPDGRISPEFAYRYLLTDVYLHDKASVGHRAILPSVATLLGSFWNIHLILWAVIRSAILVFLSMFGDTPVYRLSAANTALVHHDGRALATCESGPPLWISLPNLDTVDWFGLEGADGTSLRKNGGTSAMTNEFTTAHVSCSRRT
jgi:carotenoid cleavage dioxygenase-like enzyme